MTAGEVLRRIHAGRASRGISQRELAAAVGVKQSTYGKWEIAGRTGRGAAAHMPRLPELIAALEAVGLELTVQEKGGES